MTPPDSEFVDSVMARVARQERRLPLVAAVLALTVLVLAVPALLALVVPAALAGARSLAFAGLREALSAGSDNPITWTAIGLAALWLAWLVRLAIGGRR